MKTHTKTLLTVLTASAMMAGFATTANAAAIVVKPTDAVASTEFNERTALQTFNDSQAELDTGAAIPGTLPTVDVIKSANWLALQASPTTDIVVADQWIVFDLGDTYDLAGILVWNYTDANSNGPIQGTDDLNVLFATSLSDVFGSAASNAADYSGSVSLNFAAQTVATSGTVGAGVGELVSLGSTKTARYVLFDIETNHGFGDGATGENGGFGRVGIGEVRFTTAVPEPGSLALLGLGGLLIASRRRRG